MICDITLTTLGLFGIIMAILTKRPSHFKIKLFLVFIIIIATTLIKIFNISNIEYINYANSIILVLIILLYWNELKSTFSISSYNKSLIMSSLDRIPELVWTKDGNGKITYLNNNAKKFFHNLDEKEIIGKTFDELLVHLANMNISYTFEKCNYKNLDSYSEKLLYGFVNNEYTVLKITKINLFDGNNKVQNSIYMARELTKQCLEHEELIKLAEENKIDELKQKLQEHVKST